MSATAVNIYQDNITDDCNLLSVHNPLIFLIDVTYTGEPTEILYCKILDEDSETLGIFKCIPYADVTASVRRFALMADSLLRGFMDELDDFSQSAGSLEFCSNMTKEFTLKFYAESEVIYDSVLIIALQGVRQFGEDPSISELYHNEPQTYIAAEGKPLYVYIYNDSELNSIGITEGSSENGLLDFDDEEFWDFDDELLIAITE
jgi:hypothetical protein